MSKPEAASAASPKESTAEEVARKVLEPFERFLYVEAASGIALLVGAAAALIWANSPWADSYEAFWETPVALGFGENAWAHSLRFVVNEGLMAIFFLIVGLEIRQEIHNGTLASVRLAALPLCAALGGVLLPALIYLSLNFGSPALEGWATPTATDIAFAVGVLALLGSTVPTPLRKLLLALAIIDDIAAILIIAVCYSADIQFSGFAIAGAGMLGVVLLRYFGIRPALPYVLPGLVLWLGVLESGIHPTIAGVILGLLTPVTTPRHPDRGARFAARAVEDLRRNVLHEADMHALAKPHRNLRKAEGQLLAPAVHVQISLHPWVAFGIVPLFALANAGVSFSGLSFDSVQTWKMTAGIFLGLVLGKPLGICAAAWLATRLGLATLPEGVNMRGIAVLGALGGIGFTMAIFIAGLAFSNPDMLATAKFTILAASVLAAVIGVVVGKKVTR